MSKIPRHIVDAVRERTDITEVIGRHVRLERRGSSFVGLCPFHQEKSGSFNVVPHKQMYYCFGCQAGGDVFRFLMQVEGLSFVEAVKELAGPAGVDVPEQELTAEELRAIRQKATLYDVLEEAAGFYESVLWARPEGAPGREYLKKRQLGQEMARKARVGYAPAGWTPLLDHLRRKGFDPKLALEVGLAKPRRDGDSAYDTFRERVLFPIRDERGRVIAFGGRLLQGDGPKYINSPETPLYQKSRVLYGLEMARQAIAQKDRALVVEGYFDVVSLHEAGFPEAIATCGTALTEHHLEKIRRMTSNVVVLLDSDEAGSKAAERVLPMFLAAGLQAWRLQLPGAKDPDELVRTEGAEAMEKALGRKEPLVEWYIDRKLDSRGGNAMAWQRTVQELVPLLNKLPDGVVSRVAARLGQPDEVLRQQVRAWRPPPAPTGPHQEDEEPPPAPMAPSWKPTRELVHLLWLLVHRYDQVADVIGHLRPHLLEAPVQPVVARLMSGEPLAGVLPEVADPEVRRTLQAIVARAELYTPEQATLGACEILEGIVGPWRDSRLDALVRAATDKLLQGDTAAYREAQEERARIFSLKSAMSAALRKPDILAYLALVDQTSEVPSSPATS